MVGKILFFSLFGYTLEEMIKIQMAFTRFILSKSEEKKREMLSYMNINDQNGFIFVCFFIKVIYVILYLYLTFVIFY